MSPTAVYELESALAALDDFSGWDVVVPDTAEAAMTVERRDVIEITSEFSTLGGSRPRQIS